MQPALPVCLILCLTFLLAGAHESLGRSPIWLAFAVEKACYVTNYVMWHHAHSGRAAWETAHKKLLYTDDLKDLLAPAFIFLYGPVDLLFFLMFLAQGLTPIITKAKRA